MDTIFFYGSKTTICRLQQCVTFFLTACTRSVNMQDLLRITRFLGGEEGPLLRR